jgi:CRISPR system Cascade subunit CasB
MPEKSEWPKFKTSEKAGEILVEWWRELIDNRGERADLRRTANPVEVMFNPAYHRLRFRLLSAGFKVHNEKLAAVVGLAARVKSNTSAPSVARQMAEPRAGKQPRVAGLRFRRVLELGTEDLNELFRVLIRLLPLVGDSVNLLDLADSVYRWNDYQRKHWALEYYSVTPEKASKA